MVRVLTSVNVGIGILIIFLSLADALKYLIFTKGVRHLFV